MKKKALISLLLLLSLLCCLTVSAHAEARLDYVNDYAGLLSDYERQSLNAEAAQISDLYDCGVYIVIVGDYREFVNGNIETFTEEVFHSYGLGYGESENGVILGMSMDDRDYDIYAHGDFGNYAFTDYGKGQLADSFLDNFRRDDWAGGFRDFVKNSGELMRRARNGEPLDQWIPDPTEQESFGPIEMIISLIVGCITGGATVGGMKKQMNALSALGLLSRFVGMLTDSRSFLSYPRHEYFRRVLCNLLGEDIENGKLPRSEMAFIHQMVKDISYNNADRYFGF